MDGSQPPGSDQPPPSGWPPGTAPPGQPSGTAQPIEASRRGLGHRLKRRRIPKRVAVVAATVLVGAAMTAAVLAARGHSKQAQRRLAARLTAGSCQVDGIADAGATHVSNPRYRTNPPDGGPHLAAAAPSGFYSAADTPLADGNVVHALEHGYVAIWYRPDLAGVELDNTLQSLSDTYGRDILVLPRTSLPVPIATTAWHHRLLCATSDRAALSLFIDTYRNHGPERVRHN
jgi:hypothetical protein